MLLWMSRGSLESVCQATMGYSFNGLDPDTPNEYADAVRRLTYVMFFAPVRYIHTNNLKQPCHFEARDAASSDSFRHTKLLLVLAQQVGRLASHETP